MKKTVNIGEFTASIKGFIKDEYGIEVRDNRIKGLAFSTLKEAGLLSREDKYKTYDHVDKVLRLFNKGLGKDIFEWEDIEHFTGNLFYCMRLATRRPLDEISGIIKRNPENKQLHTDLTLLTGTIKQNMSKTWKYIEKTQESGAGMIINKFLQYINEKNIQRSKNGKDIQKKA